MKTIEQIPVIPESGIIIRQEGAVLRVFFDIRKAPRPRIADDDADADAYHQPEDLCECYNVDVKAPVGYGSIIAAIVNDKYSADDAQALISNLTEARDETSAIEPAKREEYISEWNAFQSWRAKAKEVARYVTEYLNR